MGLEKKVVDIFDPGYKLEEVLRMYPDKYGKIHASRACVLAQGVKKPEGLVHWTVGERPTKPLETKALDCFKGLAVLMYRVNKVYGNQEYVKTLFDNALKDCKSGNAIFSEKDLDFYKDAADFVMPFIPDRGLSLLYNFGEEQFKQKIREFEQKTDLKSYTDALEQLDFLMKFLMIGIKDHEKKKLSVLNRFHKLHLALYDEFRAHHKADSPIVNVGLEAILNHPSKYAMANRIDCCIAPPDGDSKEASILYRLDKSVHTWHTECGRLYNLKMPGPFGLVILVEAKGHHASTPKKETKYLVLEGYPANRLFYNSIDQLEIHMGILRRKKSYQRLDSFFPTALSLPQAIYYLSLLTAKQLGIGTLFINTAHSGEQKSVEYTVREAARMYSVPRECWEFGKHKDFKLLKDPYTNAEFQILNDPSSSTALLDKSGQPFGYTHFLKKSQISSNIISRLRRVPDWSGEGFFDTWYVWNEFIMATYPEWSDKMKAEHPYAEAVWRRGKDPQWNLGIGYCKGFEVDVAKECKRLGIS